MLTHPITTTEIPGRRVALIAGIGYLAIFVLAIFANFFVRTGLIDPNDAAATFHNITESESLFRTGLLAFLIVFLLDVVISWALYVLLKNVNKEVSRVTAWFRLVYTGFLGVALVFFFMVLELVGDTEYTVVLGPGETQAQAALLLGAFNATWYIGLAAFGIHLILVGFLLRRSGTAPRFLSAALTLAGAAYVIDTAAFSLMSNYANYESIFLAMVALPSVVGELALTIWLLRSAGKPRPAFT